MTEEKKSVAILVPKRFQNRQLLRPDDSGVPHNGECMTCRGTGAIPHRVWLEDPVIEDWKIISATPKVAWEKCKCGKGQFWIRFDMLNVEAILLPKWRKELHDMKEKAKEEVIRGSGGSYTAGTDTFLKCLEYKAPKAKPGVVSLDQIVRDSMIKKGDIPS